MKGASPMLRTLLALALIWTTLPTRAYADSFKVLGPRPLGMGGAFVAMAEGGLAQYWNPAGLAQENASKWGAVAGVGGRAEFTGGILNDANTLGDLASKFGTIKSAQ